MVKTDYTVGGQELSYEIFEDGYAFYLGDNAVPWISQRAPYDKVVAGKDYEERAQNHLKEISKDQDEPVKPSPNIEERLAAIERQNEEILKGISESL